METIVNIGNEKKRHSRAGNSGFSLIELLVVLAIIFILGLQEIVWAILRVNSAEDHTSIGFQAF